MAAVAIPATVLATPASGWAAAGSTALPVTPYSGIAAPERGPNGTHVAAGVANFSTVSNSGTLALGSNVDVMNADTTQLATAPGTTDSINTCNAGKPTAQNETTIAVDRSNPSDLVGGTNDYRLLEQEGTTSSGTPVYRYDGSGGFYTSTDGGATWTDGFLPGLVKGNSTAPGSYESAGDPSVSAGPSGTFWYANLAFNRSDAANSVAVNRSTDGGATWSPATFPIQTSSTGGATLFNDKEWIAADPANSGTAYVTWTQFHTTRNGTTKSSPIVISKTADGGTNWTAPVQVSPLAQDQGSTVVVSGSNVYVTFETFRYHGHDWAAEATSADGGATFSTKLLSIINDIPSPLPGDTFRDDSFPTFAVDGSNQYVAWSNWNGSNADIVVMTSTDNGATWSAPETLAGGAGNQFFPWLSANGGKVAATWYDDNTGTANTYNDVGTMTSATGAAAGSWATPSTLSTAVSDVAHGNLFSFPTCAANFIGDYNAVALDSTGTAHALWTDIRDRNTGPSTDPLLPTNQDPYTTTLALATP